MVAMKVWLLPDPLSPTTPRHSPATTCKEMPRTASTTAVVGIETNRPDWSMARMGCDDDSGQKGGRSPRLRRADHSPPRPSHASAIDRPGRQLDCPCLVAGRDRRPQELADRAGLSAVAHRRGRPAMGGGYHDRLRRPGRPPRSWPQAGAGAGAPGVLLCRRPGPRLGRALARGDDTPRLCDSLVSQCHPATATACTGPGSAAARRTTTPRSTTRPSCCWPLAAAHRAGDGGRDRPRREALLGQACSPTRLVVFGSWTATR